MSHPPTDPAPATTAGAPPTADSTEFAGIARELDAVWPDWRSPDRQKRRFDSAAYPAKARIKWLLKRRELLQKGLGAWTIKIVPDTGNPPTTCFAHPIPPRVESRYETTDEPPSPLVARAAVAVVVPPAPELAKELGLALADVQAALAARPGGADPGQWVRDWPRPPPKVAP